MSFIGLSLKATARGEFLLGLEFIESSAATLAGSCHLLRLEDLPEFCYGEEIL